MRFMKGFGTSTALAAVVFASGTWSAGCGRVVVDSTKTMDPGTTVSGDIVQRAPDKVDLLLMIDNSSGMGDKQAVLADAVPTLLQGLIHPACVSADGRPLAGGARANPAGESPAFGCPAGSRPEFHPVTDMHVGIISSSLGGMGGDVCSDTNTASVRQNDHGHLLNISGNGGPVPEASPSNFLSWFPRTAENEDTLHHPTPVTTPIGDDAQLASLFASMAIGVGQTGCGFEAQLESIYRFLIQPDPWDRVVVNDQQVAELVDVDTLLLQQRADFLRPDSLVAVVALTDEDDSSADPLSVNGQGWYFMNTEFAGSPNVRPDGVTTTAPRASSACKTDPGSENCQSCAFAIRCTTESWCAQLKNDPECQKTGGYYDGNEEPLNVRFHRMKERFGLDPQYPISRYVDGLTNAKVPDRSTEHPSSNGRIDGYTGTPKCTNPLFAARLPRSPGDDLCSLPVGPRSPDHVIFAVIGGVPGALLPPPGSDEDVAWEKLLGRAPEKFDYTGLDPHMIPSVDPRPGIPGPSSTPGDNGTDPMSGREWDTGGQDLQYACTFDLPKPRDCSATPASCDCDGTHNPPVCGSTPTLQVKAKAYPTVRPLEVVRALGARGAVGSICPTTLQGDENAPSYGYNPAVASILRRIKDAMGDASCIATALTRNASGDVACRMFVMIPDSTCAAVGLSEAAPADIAAERNEGLPDGAALCMLPQVGIVAGATCTDVASASWCYVENTGVEKPAGASCAQAIVLSETAAALAGARFELRCSK